MSEASTIWDLAALWIVVVGGIYTAGLGMTFVLAFFDGAGRPGRLGAPELARAFAREWLWSLVMALTYPLGWLPRLPFRHDPAGGPPILLVHGFLMNRACMFALYWRIRRLGYANVATVNLGPMLGSIATIGAGLAAELRALSARCGGAPVTCVAHSMGGLVVRWCLANDPTLPVARLVAIASPHRGSRCAYLSPGDNAREMRPGSALLASLELPEAERPDRSTRPQPEIVSFYTLADNIVLPPESAAYGHRQVQLNDWAHMGLLYAAEAFEHIAVELPDLEDRPSAEPGTEPGTEPAATPAGPVAPPTSSPALQRSTPATVDP